MKITVKEQLNFQELINFIYDNNIKNGKFLPDSNDFINTVWVDNYALEFDDDSYITKDDTWTIKHKVEITCLSIGASSITSCLWRMGK